MIVVKNQLQTAAAAPFPRDTIGPPSLASNLDIKLDIRKKDIKVDVYMRCFYRVQSVRSFHFQYKFSLKEKRGNGISSSFSSFSLQLQQFIMNSGIGSVNRRCNSSAKWALK
jgi:hypothetical protein